MLSASLNKTFPSFLPSVWVKRENDSMDTGKGEENVLFNDTDSKCYMESRVWLRTIQVTREETRCRYFVGYLVSSKVCYMDHPRQDSITHTHTHTHTHTERERERERYARPALHMG